MYHTYHAPIPPAHSPIHRRHTSANERRTGGRTCDREPEPQLEHPECRPQAQILHPGRAQHKVGGVLRRVLLLSSEAGCGTSSEWCGRRGGRGASIYLLVLGERLRWHGWDAGLVRAAHRLSLRQPWSFAGDIFRLAIEDRHRSQQQPDSSLPQPFVRPASCPLANPSDRSPSAICMSI